MASPVLKPLSSLRSHGGRSSVSGATVTVFGGTGFLGRYVINRLGKMGCRVVVPFRGDEIMVRHLKPMGDLGVVNFFDMSIRSPEQIQTAVAGSNIVINLLGKHFETRSPAPPSRPSTCRGCRLPASHAALLPCAVAGPSRMCTPPSPPYSALSALSRHVR